MSDEKTELKAVCELVGVTRRTIQGYESKGLVKAIDKTIMGHLLYGENEIKRIAYIRYCQRLGFSLDEIKTFIDEDVNVHKEHLNQQIKILGSVIDSQIDLVKTTQLLLNLSEVEFKEKTFEIIQKKGGYDEKGI